MSAGGPGIRGSGWGVGSRRAGWKGALWGAGRTGQVQAVPV